MEHVSIFTLKDGVSGADFLFDSGDWLQANLGEEYASQSGEIREFNGEAVFVQNFYDERMRTLFELRFSDVTDKFYHSIKLFFKANNIETWQ